MAFDLHLAFSKAHVATAALGLFFTDKRFRGLPADFARVFTQPKTTGVIHTEVLDVVAADSGTARTMSIDLRFKGPIGLFVQVKYPLYGTERNAEAFVGPLAADDQLSLHFLDTNTVIGNVVHRKPHIGGCLARCADGSSQQGCITCQAHGVTIKICC